MRRRAVLSALLGGSAAGIAGCTGRPEGVAVAGVEIINLSRTPWSVRVELRRDDEVVWSETESVAIDEQRPLECTWPRTPGEYTIAARLDSGDGRVERPLADADGGRVGAFVVVGLRESISVEVTDGYARPAGFSGACE